MAGIGFSMMKKRKEYRAKQDSMNGPYDTKTQEFSGTTEQMVVVVNMQAHHTHVWKEISVSKDCNCKHLYFMLILM